MKYLFGFWAALLLVGCGDEDPATRNNDFVPLTGITVTSATDSIPAGFINQFTADGDFSGQFTRDITSEVTWESSNRDILTFDAPNDGVARGVTVGGPVTVTASSSNGISGTRQVTVINAPLLSIEVIAQPVATLPVPVPKGRTQQFAAIGTFNWDGETFERDITGDVDWSVPADQNFVTINSSGLATAVSTSDPAAVLVTASFGEVSGQAGMIVTEPLLESITLTPGDPKAAKGQEVSFKAVANYSDGSKPDITTEAAWESSDTAVATIGAADGKAKAVNYGTTTIAAEFSGKRASTTLTVARAASIQIIPLNPAVNAGNSIRLYANATLQGGGTQDVTNFATWSVSNSNASVHFGMVQALTRGQVQVTAAFDGVEGTTTVTINP